LLELIARSLVRDILALYSQKTGKKPQNLVALDVGCGYGIYAHALAIKVKRVVAVEPYNRAYEIAKGKTSSALTFVNSAIDTFNTKERFDLIVMITTLEHMQDAQQAFRKIFGLLKNGSIIYLTTPNKLWPLESHYKLPFLSYLPLPLANIYMRFAGKGTSYEDCSYSKTYWDLRNLLKQFPCTFHFQLPDPSSPYLGMGTNNWIYHVMKNIGISLMRRFPILWVFSKGFIVVVQKDN
jgi:ubiquinone/menaquinone biosynthesis C-methylase UbiE